MSSSSSSVGVSVTAKTVKTVLNGDFRRFLLSKPSFDDLKKSLVSTYGESLPSSFSVKYQDDEEEYCTITSDVELLEAFNVCEKHKRPVLKLFLSPLDEPMDTAPDTKATESKGAEKKDLKKKDEQKETPQKATLTREAFLEKLRIIMQDSKAQAALPEAVNAALSAIERAVSLQDLIKIGVDASAYLKAQPIVKELVLQLGNVPADVNQKFLLLKTNPSTVAMIRMYLPAIVANIPLLISMLPMFLESLASGGFGGPFGGGFPFGGPGPFGGGPPFGGPGPFGPSFGGGGPFVGHHFGPGPFGGAPFSPPTSPAPTETKSSKEEIHSGVRCDGCNVEPIRGVRYKCSVCANYDLCQQCEMKDVHPEHSFLKIRASETSSETESEAPQESGGWGRGWGRGWRRGGHHGMHGMHHAMHGMHHGMHGGRGRFSSLFGPQAQNWRCGRGDKPEKVRVKFVENVTIPERAVVLPNQTLIKTWRVENVGKTDWPENSRLIFLRGDRSMSTEEEFPVPTCKAGQSVEISAVILTPAQQGRHTAVFRLADSERVPFGPRLWCDVVVPDLSGGSVEQPAPVTTLPVPSAPAASGSAPMEISSESKTEKPKTEEPKYAIQMRALASMGFKNEEQNKFLLEKYNGNVQTVCEHLLQNLR